MRKLMIVFIIVSSWKLIAGERFRQLGFDFWSFRPGKLNAITDVAGILVGQKTIIRGEEIRTGITVVWPHGDNIFQHKVPAAFVVANGFGKFAGSTQIEELGLIESPIVLTNTLAVGTALQTTVNYLLKLPGNENVQSVNVVVGECNDGYLNDIRQIAVKAEDIYSALQSASSGPVAEGNTGAGTGTLCLGFKGGIGTASRKLPPKFGQWTIGVLVQTNFGGNLMIGPIPVFRFFKTPYFKEPFDYSDRGGSCIIVLATDAPLDSRQLKRVARRAAYAISRVGGVIAHGSGEYVIAFTTNERKRINHNQSEITIQPIFPEDQLTPLFVAAVEATEEAILNSMTMAETMRGFRGNLVRAIDLEKLSNLLRSYQKAISLEN